MEPKLNNKGNDKKINDHEMLKSPPLRNWQSPTQDINLRREASLRIAEIMNRGMGNKARDKRREYRVTLALEQLCYENAISKEEYTEPTKFKILLHRMAAEKAKRRRGRQWSDPNPSGMHFPLLDLLNKQDLEKSNNINQNNINQANMQAMHNLFNSATSNKINNIKNKILSPTAKNQMNFNNISTNNNKNSNYLYYQQQYPINHSITTSGGHQQQQIPMQPADKELNHRNNNNLYNNNISSSNNRTSFREKVNLQVETSMEKTPLFSDGIPQYNGGQSNGFMSPSGHGLDKLSPGGLDGLNLPFSPFSMPVATPIEIGPNDEEPDHGVKSRDTKMELDCLASPSQLSPASNCGYYVFNPLTPAAGDKLFTKINSDHHNIYGSFPSSLNTNHAQNFFLHSPVRKGDSNIKQHQVHKRSYSDGNKVLSIDTQAYPPGYNASRDEREGNHTFRQRTPRRVHSQILPSSQN